MKIAITADPELPVPPKLYGGIERVIDMLVRGLRERGHEVCLFAHVDSDVPCTMYPYPGKDSLSRLDTLRNTVHIARHILGGRYDIVHSFGRVAYLLPLLPLRIPKLMTYQREVTPRSVSLGHRMSHGSLHFSGISNWMIQSTRHLANWHMVYNGVPMHVYDCVSEVAEDAPLVFLGRIEPIKGTHLAIEIARKSGRRLIIAGNIPPHGKAYFETEIRPNLDEVSIRYVGPVDDAQKNSLLGQAYAFLMPILWEEPFGIVMAEALACGTPVLGLARGSVPEVVSDGETGFVRNTVDELVACVEKVSGLSRLACRQRAEQMFSETAIVEAYLAVYREVAQSVKGGSLNAG